MPEPSAPSSPALWTEPAPGGAAPTSYATALLAVGVDGRIIHTLMRHGSLATTGRYLGVTLTQQRAALDSLTIVASATLDTGAELRA